MPVSQGAIAVALVVAVDLVVVPLIIRAVVQGSWGDLEKKFPARPPAADAVRRQFQSVRIGMSNFGGCAHIAVDRDCLHLLPARFIRWFGAGPISVPWDRLEDPSPARSGVVTARLGATKLTAPAWAVELCGRVPAGAGRA